MPRDWDAATYDRIADPMFEWGTGVLGWLELEGDETVLDAGCGSGRVTELLLERLPRGHVVALDGSPSMIEEARRRLARFGDRASYLTADLLEPLPVPPVAAILSTATFHWVPDHDRLFDNLAAVLVPGGQLAAQCGGAGNLSTVATALRGLGVEPFTSKVYSSAEAAAERLERAGFVEVACWLHPETAPFDSVEDLETFLRTVVLGDHIAGMAAPDAAAFVARVVEGLPAVSLDYVRLNIRARRG
jgi:trans-aconitate 2-methyltransferase